MMLRAPLHAIVATVLACGLQHAGAEETKSPPAPKRCDRQEYPAEALRLKEEGVTLVGFLIGTDGIVEKTIILNPSGSATLDQAAEKILSTCVFKPATSNGNSIPVWEQVAYNWALDDDPGMAAVRMRLAVALQINKDDANALYYASLLKASGASDAERGESWALLQRAAELGHAHAQFSVAQRYEQGMGVPADKVKAARWYKKAAAQGDVFAVQHLENRVPGH